MSVLLRRLSSTGRPMLMFGTNMPSITSKCSQSAPAARTASTSSLSLTKSADSSEGAIFIIFGTSVTAYMPGA